MKKLTVGILAHVDSGKTTLSEALLYLSGRLRTLGRVDKKDAFLDNFAIEREHGITVFSKQAVFTAKTPKLRLSTRLVIRIFLRKPSGRYAFWTRQFWLSVRRTV